MVLLLSSLLAVNFTRQTLLVREEHRFKLFSRSLFGVIAFTAVTYAYGLAPSIEKQIVVNTAPFWTTLIAWLVIRERVGRLELFAMAASFTGVILMALSALQHGHAGEGGRRGHLKTKEGALVAGCMLWLTSAVCLAVVGV